MSPLVQLLIPVLKPILARTIEGFNEKKTTSASAATALAITSYMASPITTEHDLWIELSGLIITVVLFYCRGKKISG